MTWTRRSHNRARAEAARSEVDFRQWVEPHWPAMRQVAERLAGPNQRDDVLQDALADAWRHRSRFDPTRGTLRTWLLAITANKAKKALRAHVDHEPLDQVPVTDTPDVRIDVRRAIRGLPTRQRIAVELCYFVGLPLGEAAAVMHCAEGTVKSTLSAARANLRAALGEDYQQ